MIIPSIDLKGGRTVQLEGGRDLRIDAGDPRPILERFSMVGETAVIDLDAAMGIGSNADLVRDLVQRAPCRVGGGIRDADGAKRWLDDGASKVILGTAATPDVLRQLPRERVIAAVDCRDGEVVVRGWTQSTGRRGIDVLRELADHVDGFLVTFVEREGSLKGLDQDQARRVIEAAGDVRVTVAGGIRDAAEIGEIDRLGADAQVGMAIYSGRFDLAEATGACLQSDRPDGLWPTVVVDRHGVALGLAYSNQESLKEAMTTRRGVYHSRTRGLWRKGESSGAVQRLVRVDLDCDRDTLRFTVDQHAPGFCHHDTWTCWGDNRALGDLARLVASRAESAPAGSYTRRLLDDPNLLASKLVEEAGELVRASERSDVVHEAADVMYFTLVKLAKERIGLDDVERELARRTLKVVRRAGDAKPS